MENALIEHRTRENGFKAQCAKHAANFVFFFKLHNYSLGFYAGKIAHHVRSPS